MDIHLACLCDPEIAKEKLQEKKKKKQYSQNPLDKCTHKINSPNKEN